MSTPWPSLISVRLKLDEDGSIIRLFAGGRAEIGEIRRIEVASQ
jgi:hypothetical protein